MDYSGTNSYTNPDGSVGFRLDGGATLPVAASVLEDGLKSIRWIRPDMSTAGRIQVYENANVVGGDFRVLGNLPSQINLEARTVGGSSPSSASVAVASQNAMLLYENGDSSFIRHPGANIGSLRMNRGKITGIPSVPGMSDATQVFNHGMQTTPVSMVFCGSVVFDYCVDFMNATQCQVRYRNNSVGASPASQEIYWIAVS